MADSAPVFKKRAKAAFKRRHESSSDGEGGDSHNGNTNNEERTAAASQPSVAEILRLQRQRQGKTRRKAVTATHDAGEAGTRSIESSARKEDEESGVERMMNKFVPQTGVVVSAYERQMNDYIEARMAEYRAQNGTPIPSSTANDGPSPTATNTPSGTAPRTADKQSVTAGRLMEVDLGASLHDSDAAKTIKQPKVRLGRDGKPWRSRRRRNSEDQARDALVDSILKETPLSRFQDPVAGSSVPASNAKSDYVDEDTVLENFKSNYQDPEHRAVRRPPASSSKQEERKGPRMGGSKNDRRVNKDDTAASKKI